MCKFINTHTLRVISILRVLWTGTTGVSRILPGTTQTTNLGNNESLSYTARYYDIHRRYDCNIYLFFRSPEDQGFKMFQGNLPFHSQVLPWDLVQGFSRRSATRQSSVLLKRVPVHEGASPSSGKNSPLKCLLARLSTLKYSHLFPFVPRLNLMYQVLLIKL